MWTKILSMLGTARGKVAGSSWVSKFLMLSVGVVLLVLFFPKIKDTIYQLFRKGSPDTEDIKQGKDTYGIAYQIAEALGTQRERRWYQISNWTEDENTAIKLLNDNKDVMTEIEDAYKRVSQSGDLWGDIQRLFNASQLAQIDYINGRL